MNTLYSALLLLLTTVLVSFVGPSITLHVSGTITSNDQKTNLKLIGAHIFVKAEHKIIAGANLDSSRHYHFSFIPENQASFDFYITAKGIDTTFLKSYKSFESDQLVWDIIVLATSKGLKINESICSDSAKIQLEQKAKFHYNYAKALNFIAAGLKTANDVDSACIYLGRAHKLQPNNVEVKNWIKEKCR